MQKLFFDLETTGTNTAKDRIIQLAIRIVNEEGKVLLSKSKLYNPGIPISPAATSVHGYKNEDLKDCPSFADDAKQLKNLFEGRIIVTFNGMVFDVPMLMAEFERAGVDVELSGKFLDALKIERKIAPHTLSATYKKYSGQELEGAHDALADVEATEFILAQQIGTEDEEKYYEDMEGKADWGGKLKYDKNGDLVFNFGKSKDIRVVDDRSYASWILSQDFPSQVKKLITAELSKIAVPPSKGPKGFHNPPKAAKMQEVTFDDDLPF